MVKLGIAKTLSKFGIGLSRVKSSFLVYIKRSDVGDSETLYRSIRQVSENFIPNTKDSQGRPILSSQAFADTSQEPSLFRHILCKNPPHSNPPLMGDNQCLAHFIAKDIRQSGPISHPMKNSKRTKDTIDYLIDVKSDTNRNPRTGEKQHKSHCVAYCTPTLSNDRAFKKLKERLSQIYQWTIEPNEELIR